MKRKILLPTDFSKNAWHAINYAINLFKNDECKFYILNAFTSKNNTIEELININTNSKTYKSLMLQSKNGLDKTLEMLKLQEYNNTKHEFTTLTEHNKPIKAIQNIVIEKNIELIVMGSQGATRSRKVAYGSTSIYVMEKVRECPAIIVPEDANYDIPKEIVFPTSHKVAYKTKELKPLIDLAKKTNANIAVLHIDNNEDITKNKQLLETSLSEVKYSYHLLSNYEIETAITVFAESRGSDIIAFVNKKHSFFGSTFNQPLVKGLGFYSKIPILTMHTIE